MTDKNYWKNAYKDLWDASSKKEATFKKFIEAETGLILMPYGLGAESNEYIAGSAKENDNELGTPDYAVENTNIFIEITGPLSEKVKPQCGLWVRPDKLKYARKHCDENDEFFALFFPSTQEWLAIHADKVFFDDMDHKRNINDYFDKNPIIRGKRESYVEISYHNPFVKDLDYLVDYLRDTVTTPGDSFLDNLGYIDRWNKWKITSIFHQKYVNFAHRTYKIGANQLWKAPI